VSAHFIVIRALVSVAKFPSRESQIILRLHARDGSVLKQQSIEASAAFGQLIVHGDIVAICVSSGEEPEDEPEYFASDSILQYRADFTSMIRTRPRPGYPDTILAWNLQSDVLHQVPIPQHEDFLMLVRSPTYTSLLASLMFELQNSIRVISPLFPKTRSHSPVWWSKASGMSALRY